MPFQFTPFNVLTLLAMALTVGVAAMRFTRKLDSNWPLAYYVMLLAFWKVFEGSFNTWWILGGTACGLLLRFEFLGGVPLKAVRLAEFVFFGYVLWRSMGLLLLW